MVKTQTVKLNLYERCFNSYNDESIRLVFKEGELDNNLYLEVFDGVTQEYRKPTRLEHNANYVTFLEEAVWELLKKISAKKYSDLVVRD